MDRPVNSYLEAHFRGPLKTESYEVRISVEFSKEPNKHRKGFLSLRPQLCQLEVKYGLFDPARIWITKDGKSRDFYEPKEHHYLDKLSAQVMDTTPLAIHRKQTTDWQSVSPSFTT
ncbi:hypothetical protein NDU88_003593 [Pleurodeles waltl]|uniref:Uncharacterized protein n=1 Tax=Pleurodeles waltl TaxID=8319 RepID=A0AAV7LG85_PLEWA|nr:hypothetical protein NDU88_003593 [Pleurodeles waltl]